LQKIDALGEEERRALQYASVEGAEFLSTITAKLLGVDEIDLEEQLAHLERDASPGRDTRRGGVA